MAYKVCPHCGSDVFIGVIHDVAAFRIKDDGTAEVAKTIADKRTYEIHKCNKCKKDVTNDDIKKTVKCSVCGEMVSEDEVNENGVCLACAYIQDNKMSQMEALRQLLKAKSEGSGPVQTAKKLKEKAKKAEEKEEQPEAEEPQETTEPVQEEAVKETKTRRKPKRKTQTEQPAEEQPADDAIKALEEEALASVEAEVNKEQTEQEAIEAIDNAQAPFPDPPEMFQDLSQPGITDSVMNDMNTPEGVMDMFSDDSDQAF